ncbi:hypothetical protein MMC20_001948 [Loxospora ochrophaea]|nr:hypothetical protein [Loxospora ochrophaea]
MVLPRGEVEAATGRELGITSSGELTQVKAVTVHSKLKVTCRGKVSRDLRFIEDLDGVLQIPAIGAIVVTVPSCAYLLQPSPSKGHGSGEHDHAEHDEHETDGDDESEEGSAGEEEGAEKQEEVDKSDEQPESSGDDGTLSSGESDDSASETGEQQDTPDTSDDEKPGNEAYETEGGGNVEGVRFKGATKGGTKEGEQGDTRKHIPDAKGANKKRIESHYGMQQGVAEDDEDQATMDKAAASKPAGSQSTQSGKQEGLSNTDTKHSTDITNNPEKSKKGEGTPETSKSKGTVDPARPQV